MRWPVTSAQILNDADHPFTVVNAAWLLRTVEPSPRFGRPRTRSRRWRPASRWGRLVTRRHNLSKWVEQVEAGPPSMREQFGRIRRISFNRSFDECVALVGDLL